MLVQVAQDVVPVLKVDFWYSLDQLQSVLHTEMQLQCKSKAVWGFLP